MEKEIDTLMAPTALKDPDLEKAVLSTCMMGNKEFGSVLQAGVNEDCFTVPGYRRLFTRMREMVADGGELGLTSIISNLSNRDLAAVGADVGLMDIYTRSVTTRSLFECNVRRLLMWRQKRAAWLSVHQCAQVMEAGGDSAEALRPVLKLAEAQAAESRPPSVANGDAVEQAWRRMEDERKLGGVTGVPTGLARLDKLTRGFQPGRSYILAARPGDGKTALALNMAVAAARALHRQKAGRVLFATLEMTMVELAERELALMGMVNMAELKDASCKLERAVCMRAMKAREEARELPITFLDAGGWSVEALAEAVRAENCVNPVSLVVIDYLQQLRSAKLPAVATSFQHTEAASRALATLARKLNVPFLSLAQLNRDCSKGTPRPPQVTDLKNSGQIEQDADMVMLLHQPVPPKDAAGEDGAEDNGRRELIIAKNRHGAYKLKIPLQFHCAYTAFQEPGE